MNIFFPVGQSSFMAVFSMNSFGLFSKGIVFFVCHLSYTALLLDRKCSMKSCSIALYLTLILSFLDMKYVTYIKDIKGDEYMLVF